MFRMFGRIGQLAAVIGFCVLGTGVARAQEDEADLRAASDKGLALRLKGQYQEALPLLVKAAELAPRVYGNDDTNTANALAQLGWLYLLMGQYAKAEPLLRRCLHIREDKLGADHPDVAISLNDLAVLYMDMGQYDKAEPLYQRSLQIREDKLGKDHLDVAQCLNNLAILYMDMGQYDKEEPLLERALQIYENKLGKDHPLVADSVGSLGWMYFKMGQYDKAEPLLRRCLQIREATLGKDHADVALGLNDLAVLYDRMGQYDKAEPLYQRSLQIWEAKLGKDHPNVAISLANLGWLYKNRGQYDKAEPLLRRSLQIKEAKLGKDHPEVARGLNDLGVLYDRMGQYDKAEPLYQSSLQIWEAKLGKDHPLVADSLANLGWLYENRGQYDKAEPLYRRCLQIREGKLGKDHPDVAHILSDLTDLYAHQGRWQEAADAADQERRLVRRHTARVLPTLSEKEQLTFLENTDAWNFHLTQSLALARSGDAALPVLSAGWVLNGKAVGQEALAQRALAAVDAVAAGTGELSKQLLGVRRQLAALSLASAKPGQEDRRRQQLDELAAQEKDLSSQLGQAGGRSARSEPWVELADVRKTLPADAALVEISRFRVHDFLTPGQHLLGAGLALLAKDKKKPQLSYHYAAWVIAAEGDVHVVDLGPADAIEDAVKAVRQALKDAQGSLKHPSTITQDGEPEAEKALLKPLQELSKLVLEPLADHIDGKKRWFISPDASLWLVPWAALPLKDGRYAVEAHTISYLVSGRDLVAPASTAKPGRPRMMADPDYDLGRADARAATADLIGHPDSSDLALRGLVSGLRLGQVLRLEGTAAEAQAVKPSLEKYAGEEVWLYQDKKALEGVFKTFKGPRVLVLSTHGFFLPDQEVAPSDKPGLPDDKRPALDKEGKPLENPLLRCGLLLAGCNSRDELKDGDDDGVLTGLEVVGTDLRGTELVVLSACETGLGDVHNGEGVAGLRQAFQLAGARSVAATLWQVPDRESAQLMSDFFARLADSKDKAEALRQAQLTMIQRRRDKNAAAHPFFWAAFTLTGQ